MQHVCVSLRFHVLQKGVVGILWAGKCERKIIFVSFMLLSWIQSSKFSFLVRKKMDLDTAYTTLFTRTLILNELNIHRLIGIPCLKVDLPTRETSFREITYGARVTFT